MNINGETHINDKTIQKIKDTLIKDGVFKESDFELEDIMYHTKKHLSLFVLVDISGSIEDYLNDINNAVNAFVEKVVEPNSIARDCLEFCYLTFNETVNVRKKLSYLSARNNNAAWCMVDKSEVGGCTDIASALFYAWYMGEKRKLYYKENGFKYYQPIIILISDLGHNFNHSVTIQLKKEPLFNIMLELIREKRQAKKLGMMEISIASPSAHSDVRIAENARKLYNLPVEKTTTSSTSQFVDSFNKILEDCYATAASRGVQIIHADREDSGVTESTEIFIDSSDEITPQRRQRRRGKLL